MSSLFVLYSSVIAAIHLIQPSQEGNVTRLFEGLRLPGECVWAGSTLNRDKIQAVFQCSEQNRPQQISVELRHPDDVNWTPARIYSVTTKFRLSIVRDPSVHPSFLFELTKHLQSHESGFEWTTQTDLLPPEQRQTPPNRIAWLLTVAILFGYFAIPIVIGFGLAFLCRRLWPTHASNRKLRWGITGITGLFVVTIAVRLWTVSIYDVLTWYLLFTASFLSLTGQSQLSQKQKLQRWMAVVATLLSLLLGEVVLRLAFKKHASNLVPGDLHLVFDRPHHAGPCCAFFPGTCENYWFHRLSPSDLNNRDQWKSVTLHVGDSMVEGAEVSADETFVERLNHSDSQSHHLNLGISSTGPDAYLFVLRTWLPRIRPQRVVVHFFMGNDLRDLGQTYPCAASGELLASQLTDVPNRVQMPQWEYSIGWRLGTGPSPYPLRWLGCYSALANSIDSSLVRVGANMLARSRNTSNWVFFERIVRQIELTIRNAGAEPTFVLMPVRATIEHSETDEQTRPLREDIARADSILHSTSAAVLNSAFVFRAALEHERLVLFQTEPSNPHLNATGHQVYEQWLFRELNANRSIPNSVSRIHNRSE